MILALAFLRKFWAPILLGLILLSAGIWWNRHVARDNANILALAQAQLDVAAWQQAHASLAAQLADAESAALLAIAANKAAEVAAIKRLKAREKEWQRVYGAKPENRAWAESAIPPDILRNMSQ